MEIFQNKMSSKQKYEQILMLREEDIKKRKSSNVTEIHTTQFDPVSGKKILHTKEITRQAEATEEHKKREAIQIEIRERQDAFKSLKQMSIMEAKTQSTMFDCYLEDVEKAILSFEKARTKLGLVYEPHAPNIVWGNSHMASVFLFDYPSSKLPGVDGHGCILSCLWDFDDMVGFGNQPNMTEQSSGTKKIFMVEPRMVSWYIFGLLLVDHVPLLKQRMRPSIIASRESDNFPQFARLRIPEIDDQPVSAIFRYSFFLQDNLTHPLPSETALTARTDYETSINCDGPLVMLFGNEQIKQSIISRMQQESLRNVPSKMQQKQDAYMNQFLRDSISV